MELSDIQVAGCAIIQGRPEQVLPNLKQTYPYVDYYALIDGGSDQSMLDDIKAIDKDNKINIIKFPWRDNFPLSRNQYLINAGKLRDPKKELYIMRFDSDEFISVAFLERMKKLILWARQNRYDGLGIRAYDITVDLGGNKVSTSLANWWKMLVYNWKPGLEYRSANYGRVHEYYNLPLKQFNIPAKEERGIENALLYKHVKTQGEVWQRAHARNFYISGGGDQLGELSSPWLEFKALVAEIGLGFKTSHDYDAYLQKGNVDERLKKFFIRYMLEGETNRDFSKYPKSDTEKYFETHQHLNGSGKTGIGYPGSSEVREGFKYYFEWLHNDEFFTLPEDVAMAAPVDNSLKEKYKNKEA